MDIETIIYIIFVILSIVFSAAQSSRRRKKKQSGQPQAEQKDYLESQWNEFMGIKEEETPKEEMTYQESTIPTFDEDYVDEEEEISEFQKEEMAHAQKMENESPYYNYDVINQQKAIEEKLRKVEELKKNSIAQKEKAFSHEVIDDDDDDDDERTSTFKFDPVQAVIYSEILKRPEY